MNYTQFRYTDVGQDDVGYTYEEYNCGESFYAGGTPVSAQDIKDTKNDWKQNNNRI